MFSGLFILFLFLLMKESPSLIANLPHLQRLPSVIGDAPLNRSLGYLQNAGVKNPY